MREFTPEEKEKIINTPITKECFNLDEHQSFKFEEPSDKMHLVRCYDSDKIWKQFIAFLDLLRKIYLETKDERYFIELVCLLPNSYKVVKL